MGERGEEAEALTGNERNPMKDREERIAWRMNYCQHYAPKPGWKQADRSKDCEAGCDIANIKRAQIPGKALKWGPCIEGHLLPDAKALCPKWERYTREQGEAYADDVERSLRKLTIAGPFIAAWRKKGPQGKAESVECPVCKGKLHLSQSGYNGHVRAHCETADCISFIE